MVMRNLLNHQERLGNDLLIIISRNNNVSSAKIEFILFTNIHALGIKCVYNINKFLPKHLQVFL